MKGIVRIYMKAKQDAFVSLYDVDIRQLSKKVVAYKSNSEYFNLTGKTVVKPETKDVRFAIVAAGFGFKPCLSRLLVNGEGGQNCLLDKMPEKGWVHIREATKEELHYIKELISETSARFDLYYTGHNKADLKIIEDQLSSYRSSIAPTSLEEWHKFNEDFTRKCNSMIRQTVDRIEAEEQQKAEKKQIKKKKAEVTKTYTPVYEAHISQYEPEAESKPKESLLDKILTKIIPMGPRTC